MAGRRITIEFLGKDVSAGKTADKVEGKYSKLSSRVSKAGAVAGKVLAGGLIAGGAAMVKFGNQASDLAETQSKVTQIFGKDSVAALDKFAAGAAKSMGQSKQTALDAAATFGIIGKSAGLGGEKLVGFSTQMTKLAGDMASFNNTSPEEAIEAIGAAMRGEAEPIRKYGVLLDDATLRQQAMKMGLIKTTKEGLTPQQKALAAQQVILKQTKDQQGDFARTSDGLANKNRILKAQFENLTTTLGTKSLPVMLKVTSAGLKMLEWTQKHSTTTKVLVGTLVGLTAAVFAISAAEKVYRSVTIAATAVQWALNAALTANPIGIVVVAIAALVAGLIIAYKKSETFRGAVQTLGRAAVWLWDHAFKPAFAFILKGFAAITKGIGKMLIALGHIPGFGWATEAGRKMLNAASGARNLADRINGIPKKHNTRVTADTTQARNAISGFVTFAHRSLNKLPRNVHSGMAPGFGGFARGGVPPQNRVSVVGERGPELFKPSQSGRIIPNNQARRMAGNGNGGVVINFNGLVTDPKATAREVRKVLLDLKRGNGGAALGLT